MRVLLCSAFCLLLLAAVEGQNVLSAVKKASHSYNASAKVVDIVDIVEGYHPDAISTVLFNNSIKNTGWSFLDVKDTRQDDSYHDDELAKTAGYMEAILTAPLISMHWKNTFSNYCDGRKDFCTKLKKFMISNREYCDGLQSSADNYQASLWFSQLEGLTEGYRKACSTHFDIICLDYYQLLMIQLFGDLEDLETVLGGGNFSHVTGSGSCSALVKLLPQNQDLFVSHDTWSDFNSMLRVFKRYHLNYRTSQQDSTVIPGNIQVFSSYPGVLHSGDDYYLISSGLVSMETTIGNSNADLWKYVTPSHMFEPVRVVMANRLAHNGKEWAAHFSLENMGTYNNQWMVVDYKLFTPGSQELKDDLLWIVEQLPGKMESSDQTEMLRKMTYWPSFNIPYYPDIYKLSGTGDLAKKYGDWFSWTGSPRAKIFARNHTQVTDLHSMMNLMRYNNFEHDELSKCACSPPYSGENSIAARSDLNPASGTYPFSALGHRRHGATDVKVTSYELFGEDLSCVAVSGPTSDQQPVFQWSTSGFQPIPEGHPDRWEFKPITIQWT